MPRCRPGLLPLVTLLLAASGCAGMHLGQIDRTRAERDDMAGPGVFADSNGETPLKWSSSDKPVGGEATAAAGLDEKTEFELYKQWRALRAQGSDSPEYREFLQWLEFREFKAAQ